MQQPSQTGRDLNTFFPRYRQWWVFAFASDKWQATPKLTLDLGVRWDFYPPATPTIAGGFSNYDPANNTLVLAGLGSNPSNLGMKTQYKYFAPRTGFAYRFRPNTVIRGGFGISYTPFPDNTYAYNYPDSSQQQLSACRYVRLHALPSLAMESRSLLFRQDSLRRFRLSFPPMESSSCRLRAQPCWLSS